MTTETPAAQALDQFGIPHRVFTHTHPPESLAEAARQRGQSPEQIVRSILFRLAEDQFVMVLMAGPGQISWKRVRAYLGVSRITMATEQEVLAVAGFVRGAVTPLGLPRPMRILADQAIFAHTEISLGSGVRGVAIIMKSSDLRKALSSLEVASFTD